ncbi:MAG: hypothetical protein GC192_13625 [Bacteroidetes bacterium]|nr:hypothetical protein [Bacteroidota bacterium]
MKKAAILFSLVTLAIVVAYLILVNKFWTSKPAFYAKVVAKEAEGLLENDTINWADFGIKLKPQRSNYTQTCSKVKAIKKSLNSMEFNEIGMQFEQLLVDEIIPHWYGTTWSFDGHTDQPQQGEIACGYFVSTTLQQVGLNVNRFQLAQQKPENEAKSLAVGTKIIEMEGANSAENIAQIKSKTSDGIYFVGLGQSHVGYLLKRKNELFFIHSSYFTPGTVTVELASKSPVFCAYSHYYIVELSNNKVFLKRWLNNKKIEVIKDK